MMDLNEIGKRFVALGRALQDDGSTIDELVGLAMDCGMQLEFRIVPEKQTPPEAKSPASDE